VAAYLLAHLEEFTDLVIQDRWVLRVGKEQGDFEPWFLHSDDFEDDINAFLAALELYRQKKAIEDRRSDENRVFSAMVAEKKKGQTADNNKARKELYNQLRSEGKSVDEATKLSREAFPPRTVKRAPKVVDERFERELEKVVRHVDNDPTITDNTLVSDVAAQAIAEAVAEYTTQTVVRNAGTIDEYTETTSSLAPAKQPEAVQTEVPKPAKRLPIIKRGIQRQA
jgi:hypothetical protein